MRILADNDVGGAVTALQRVLQSVEWAEYAMGRDRLADVKSVEG